MASLAAAREPHRGEYQQWVQSGRPETSRAQLMREFEEYERQRNMTEYQRMSEGDGYTQRVTEDVLTQDVGIPGYENVVVPGTSIGIKGLGNYWSGDSWNPFYTR